MDTVKDFLMQTYTIALGSIPSYAYENFLEMYEAYHKLGGNGMITKMKEEIEELHLGKSRKENEE